MSSQSDWNAAAAAIGPLNVCGCEFEVMGGQEMFRSLNFARTMKGLAITNTVPDVTMNFPNVAQSYGHLLAGSGKPDQISIQWSGTHEDTMAVINQGKGLDNLVFDVPSGSGALFYTAGSPVYDALWSKPAGALICICTWGTTFIPGGMVCKGIEYIQQ